MGRLSHSGSKRNSDVLLVVQDGAPAWKTSPASGVDGYPFATRPTVWLPSGMRCRTDDMSNSRERKMITHYLDPIGRDAAQNGLARLDRLRAIVVEDGRPVGVLQARHRVMGDVTHMHELRGEARLTFQLCSVLTF
jgi:hypothetical protein